MIIIQYVEPGIDCPEELAGNEKFRDKLIYVTRRKLELGPEDIVVVKFGKISDFPESKVITI
jgi:hypothetical protein